MKVYYDIQYSPFWWEIRKKRMTASHAQAIAANGAGLKTYILDIMRPLYSNVPEEQYTNKTLERGLELEESAGMVYSFESGIDVKTVGFITSGEYVGASPDLLAGEDGLVEIKCPEDKTYFKYLCDGKIDTKYMWQMQMQMMVCERNWCDYMVYNPNFRNDYVITRVEPDKKRFESLKKGIKSGIKMIKDIEKMMGK